MIDWAAVKDRGWCAAGGAALLPLVYRDRAGRTGWQIVAAHLAWAFHDLAVGPL